MDEGGKYIQTRLTVQYMGLDTKSEFRWQFRNGILFQFRRIEAHEPQQLNWNKIPYLNCRLNSDLVSNPMYCTVSLVLIYLPPSSILHHSSLLHILLSCHHASGEEKA